MLFRSWPAVINLANALGTALVSAAGGVYQAMTELVTPFEGLATAVTDTFGSIFAALTANDIGAAADVFWASLNVAWTTGIAAITDQWYAWKNGFLDVFGSAMAKLRSLWSDTQNYLSRGIVDLMAMVDSSINAEAVKAEIDVMTTQQKQQIDQQALQDQQARAQAYATQLDSVQKELATARDEWHKAVIAAGSAAATAANQPNVADTATGKFDELIRSMKTGDIATRVDKAVQQAGPSQDIRTSAGAGVLTSIINQQGTLSQQQLSVLKETRDLQRRLVKVTSDGMIGWAV